MVLSGFAAAAAEQDLIIANFPVELLPHTD